MFYLIGLFLALCFVAYAIWEEIRDAEKNESHLSITLEELVILVSIVLASWITVLFALFSYLAHIGWFNSEKVIYTNKKEED